MVYRNIRIAGKIIGKNSPVFFIAEIGCNFEQHIAWAKDMVVKAAHAGADAVKFQTFIPERLASKDSPKFWDIKGCPGQTQLEEFQSMRLLSFEEYKELKMIADKNNIILFSTPADESSVDLLERLRVPAYKVSSLDITHLPLVKYIASKGKPIIMSTGASNISEIKEAISVIESKGNKQIVILHCISSYPTQIKDVNLKMMVDLMQKFPDYPVGYSDHTESKGSIQVISAAVALGARVIEKHFTFDKNRDGYDHQISADYKDLRKMIQNVRLIEKALGSSIKRPILSEKKARLLGRRSIVAKVDIPKGSTISRDMLSIKRPGTGIEPKLLDAIIGKKALKDIEEDEVIDNWMMKLSKK